MANAPGFLQNLTNLEAESTKKQAVHNFQLHWKRMKDICDPFNAPQKLFETNFRLSKNLVHSLTQRLVPHGPESHSKASTPWSRVSLRGNLNSLMAILQVRKTESEYVGFNNRKLLEKIKTLTEKPVLGSVQEDVAYGVMLFLERGSSVVAKQSADTARMSQEGFNFMSRFIKHYQIAPKVKGATTITLPRWFICFPLMTVAYCETRSNFIVPVPTGFPKVLTVSAGLSLIGLGTLFNWT